jgi:phage terminase large subunit
MARVHDREGKNRKAWYQPFARQLQFHKSQTKYRLFGGAAGPGKTKSLLWEAIRLAERVPGCDTLLLRRTFPELESSLLAQFRRDVPRDRYISYNEAKHLVTWRNGSTTRFGYCRDENDVYQYQGAEYLFIGIDELTHFTLKQWQFLTSRNRCRVQEYPPGRNAGRRVVPCMAGATNPGNIGHAWVKALWIDKKPPAGYDRPEQYDPRDYEFIPARITDNPIYANDQNYLKTLEALPDRLRRAFLEGDWSVLSGQYFDVFEIGRHTARAEEIGIQAWWPRWISIDWGFHHPSAVYWHCAVPVLAIGDRRSGGEPEAGIR